MPYPQVVAQFQEKNEELALKSAKISEQDWEEMRTEFEQRLAAAERKVCMQLGWHTGAGLHEAVHEGACCGLCEPLRLRPCAHSSVMLQKCLCRCMR